MKVEDWSTRKLKRRYLKAIKRVWYEQQYLTSTSTSQRLKAAIWDELKHRGWHL